jgi:hypothetical protein
MINNLNGVKVSAKEAAKSYLNHMLTEAVANYSGSEQMTDKELAKVKEQLDKISARLLAKLVPAE